MSALLCSGRRFGLRAALAVAVLYLGTTEPARAQTFPGTGSPGDPYEVHGLLYSGSAPAGFALGDAWAQGPSFVGVLDDDGNPTIDPDTGYLFRAKRQVDENWGNEGHGYDPSAFAGSNKNFDLIGIDQDPWHWDGNSGGGPQKNDITNVYLHTRLDPVTGDRWVYVAAETRSINGDSNVDFEFNQAGVVQERGASGKLIGLGPDGGRTVNDFIISINFEHGGEMPVASAHVWDGSAYVLLDVADAAYSATNLVDILHATGGEWKHFTADGAETDTLTHLQFVEAGVNLNALGIEVDACAIDATFLVKTRSSTSFTSDLKDFSLVHFPLEPMPEVEVSAPDRVCPGAVFEPSAVETTGLPGAQVTWEISGCGQLLRDPTSSTITVQAGSGCDCEITLTARVTGGECGNEAMAQTTVTVRDDTAPVLSGVPTDDTVPCDSIPDPPVVTATDDCSEPTVEYSESVVPGDCVGGMSITRTWTATDACGNKSAQSQSLTVEDTEAPELTIPPDVTIECDEDDQPAHTGQATATDNCDPAPIVTFSDSVADGDCPQERVITRTWTAEDACGNSSSGDQLVNVVDTTAPELTVPADATIECDEDDQPGNTGQATATDNCDPEPTVTFSDSVADGACPQEWMITRTWRAEDACSNFTIKDQIINVVDTTAPDLIIPDDVTIECDEDDQPGNTGQATATDNCDPAPTVTFADSVADGACPDEWVITRTWTAEDACGKSSSKDQIITVEDTMAPILSDDPEDIVADCKAVPPPPTLTAEDNCLDDVVVQYDEEIIPGSCIGNYTLARSWSATDACGNSASVSQSVTVQDTTAPRIKLNPDQAQAYICYEPATLTVSATDDCGTVDSLVCDFTADFPERVLVTVHSGGAYEFSLVGAVVMDLHCDATDDCGNTSSLDRTITAECGDEACSPGFWRNKPYAWCDLGFNPVPDYCYPGPATLFVEAFQLTDLSSPEVAGFDPGITLLDVVNNSSGSFNQTLRQGATALLNALHPDVHFPTTACRVRETMQNAFAGLISLDEALAIFNEYNAAEHECGCNIDGLPLDRADFVCEGREPPDDDSDGDGVYDCDDECPYDAFKIEAGLCGCGADETDSDGDKTPDCVDLCPLDPGKVVPGICGCGAADDDSDVDGAPDCQDACPDDPNKIDPGICGCGVADDDSDGDAEPDCTDECADDPNKIDPGVCGCGVADDDSDADGTLDCQDECPNDAGKIDPGICGCGVPDDDADGDAEPDCTDGCADDPYKIDPGICGCGVADDDSDADGALDCQDGCPNDAGKIDPGVCGCGVPDDDADGDSEPDCTDECADDPNKIEPGICGCGVADDDSDADGALDCQDGCPNDAGKIDPGICGCGTPDIDTDGDGTPDCLDNCPAEPGLTSPNESAVELSCDDGIDNDCDGAVDAADSDCRDDICLCGDLDGDGVVQFRDFATFAACYGYSAPNPPNCDEHALGCSDLDGSGTVDLIDFSTFSVLLGKPAEGTPPSCLK